jgi:hypothetical protein
MMMSNTGKAKIRPSQPIGGMNITIATTTNSHPNHLGKNVPSPLGKGHYMRRMTFPRPEIQHPVC